MPISPKDAELVFAKSVQLQIEKQLALHNFSITGFTFSEEICSEPLPDSVLIHLRTELENMGYGEVRYNPRPDDKSAIVFQVTHYPGRSVEIPLSDVRQAELDKVIAHIDYCLGCNKRTFLVSELLRACEVHPETKSRMIYEVIQQFQKAGWKVVLYDIEDEWEKKSALKFTPK